MGVQQQFRSVVQWEQPREHQVFMRFTERGDELKNASKLVLQPGQGCIFTHEGRIAGVFAEEGLYDLHTANIPFITTLKKVLNLFESEHKVGLWFYRQADLLNIRWGTRLPITYNDPVYALPVELRGFGNFSVRITDPQRFFTNVVAGQGTYFAYELQEVFLSRVGQTISNYLANARFSYAEVDANLERIAAEAAERMRPEFEALGFRLLDLRIEGTSFTEATQQRIAGISDVQADVRAAKLAGVDFAEFQRLKALRDAARNEGAAGAGAGLFAGLGLGQQLHPPAAPATTDVHARLKKLKQLFEEGLLDEQEFAQKKQELLKEL